jgi:hypothetical protein
MTLFNPQYFDFIPVQKLRKTRSEVFLVQILRKLRKIHSEVHIKGKKTSENAFRILKSRAKTEIRGGGRIMGGGKRKFRPAWAQAPVRNKTIYSVIEFTWILV